MISENSRLVSEAYKQLPLGVTIRDYSGVKQSLDQFLEEGIDDLGRYLSENPEVLFNLVMMTETIDANDSMLKMFRVDSLQEYINLDADFEHWKDTEWEKFHCQQFVMLADGKSHFDEFLELASDGAAIETKNITWIPAGHEDDWSLVITTHEDVTEKKLAAKTLRERDMQIEQSLRLAQMGTWAWDQLKNEYEYVSPEFAEIFGYDVDQFLAEAKKLDNYLFCIHGDDIDFITGVIEEGMEGHKPWQMTYRIIRKDGVVRTVQDIAQPFYETDGTFVRSIGCTQDITHLTTIQKELVETQNSYQWAAEIGKLGHYVWDDILNKCEYCSPELAKLYGMTAEEFIEISMKNDMNLQLVHPDDQDMYASVATNLDQDLDVVFRTIRHDGTVAFFQEYGRRVRDKNGIPLRTDGIIRDVTVEKDAEDAIRVALDVAERANQAKSEFLATMSHEFRTPLNAILGFSEMISAQYFGPLGSDNYKEYANDIHQSGLHMLGLVNDILDVASVEAGKRTFSREACSIDDLVKSSLKNVDHAAKKAGLVLLSDVPDDLPPLFADSRSVRQILLNLLSNAIKFTERDGEVKISVDATNHEMIIKVSDTGIGIPSDKLPGITQPFSQAHYDAHIAKGGTGLGLSIVDSLMDAHDGELMIESLVGKGTTVTVVFPFLKIAHD